MSSIRADREEDNENKSSGSSILGALAAVGVGVGIGAMLYYFMKPSETPQEPGGHGSSGNLREGAVTVSRPDECQSGNSQMLKPDELDEINTQLFRERAWTLEMCSICLEELVQNTELWVLPCGHKFHVNCARPWAAQHNKCPNCRKTF